MSPWMPASCLALRNVAGQLTPVVCTWPGCEGLTGRQVHPRCGLSLNGIPQKLRGSARPRWIQLLTTLAGNIKLHRYVLIPLLTSPASVLNSVLNTCWKTFVDVMMWWVRVICLIHENAGLKGSLVVPWVSRILLHTKHSWLTAEVSPLVSSSALTVHKLGAELSRSGPPHHIQKLLLRSYRCIPSRMSGGLERNRRRGT